MLRKWIFVVALLLAVLIVPTGAQSDLKPVTVFLPFIPNIQFAPVYVAIEKGYFAEAGLEVTVEYGFEPDGLERLALGDLQYAFVGGEQAILARAQDRPIQFVYQWYQRNPIALVIAETADGAAISDPAELAGQRVGIPGRFGNTYTTLLSFLNTFELSDTDVQLEEIGFNAPDVICTGAISIAAVYINNEPLQVRDRAAAGECGDVTGVQVIALADYAPVISNGLAVGDDYAAENTEEVMAFLAGFEQALNDTILNPAEAYSLSLPHIETLPYENAEAFESAAADAIAADEVLAAIGESLNADEKLQLEVLVETIKLWDTTAHGGTELEAWEATQDSILLAGFLEEAIDLETVFTNDYLPMGDL
ncbi:MAG: ABC transporter substrate-binding protein [Phototrophicaceae bacterium]|jgi:NitT/TauT family transport system substrate-binding protein